mmetsp:Transcript_5240/g.9381  ORF Transcript_5240/g.9381 Transcript_5240/m.9381 type:complete len:212 (-) Transcript_5240:2312-2947(-)
MAQDHGFLGIQELGHIVMGPFLDLRSDLLRVSLQPLAQNTQVGLRCVHHILLLITRHLQLQDIQLIHHIVLQLCNVIHILLGMVDHDHLLHWHLQRNVLLRPDHACQIDDRLHALDLALNHLIQKRTVGFRDQAVVHGLLPLVLRQQLTQFVVHILSDEGDEGAHEMHRRHQHTVQRRQGLPAVLNAVAVALEAPAVHSHVPVCEIVQILE